MAGTPFLAQFFERRSALTSARAALGTMTGTASANETLDTDESPRPYVVASRTMASLGTQTFTEGRESPDQDPAAAAPLGTQTMTRGNENGDNDLYDDFGLLQASVL